MPYKSDRQRRWMHANHPEMAARWDAEERRMNAKRVTVRGPSDLASQGTVGKAYQPGHFLAPAPGELVGGRRERTKMQAQQSGATAAAAAAGLGASYLGSNYSIGDPKNLERAQRGVTGAQQWANRNLRAPGAPRYNFAARTNERLAARSAKVRPHRNKYAAGAVAAGGVAAGFNTLARWRRDEVAGIGEELGRARAGRYTQQYANRVAGQPVQKSALLYASLAHRGAKKFATLSPVQQKAIVGGVGATGIGWGGWGAKNTVSRHRRDKAQLRAAGGSVGPSVVKEPVRAAAVGKADSDYAHLPASLRNAIAERDRNVRAQTVSPLDQYAAADIYAKQKYPHWWSVRRRRKAREQMMNENYSRALAYTPFGRGVVNQ